MNNTLKCCTLATACILASASLSAVSLMPTDLDYVGDFSGSVTEHNTWIASDTAQGVLTADLGGGYFWDIDTGEMVRQDVSRSNTTVGFAIHADSPELANATLSFDYDFTDAASGTNLSYAFYGFSSTLTGNPDGIAYFEGNTGDNKGPQQLVTIISLTTLDLSTEGTSGSVSVSGLNVTGFDSIAFYGATTNGNNTGTPIDASGAAFDNVAVIPEPSTFALLAGALGLVLVTHRRRRA